MFCKFIFFFTFISFGLCSTVPVLIWGSQRTDIKPSLEVISTEKFGELISKHMRDCMFVVFVENKLSNSDLSHCKTDSGLSCYNNLTHFTPKTYYISVEDPINALRRAADSKQYVIADTDGELDTPVTYEVGKVVFVNFEEGPSESLESLHSRHSDVMAKEYQRLSNLGKVVAVYTSSEENTHSRVARQVTPTPAPKPSEPKTFNPEGKCLIYFKELKYGDEKELKNINIEKASLKESAPKVYDIELADGQNNKMTFQTKFANGYWTLQNLKWNDDKFRVDPEISVPEEFSYYCGISSVYVYEKTKIIWTGLQIQPFTKSENTPKFGDPWHCVGFTSAGIWSGLFVSFMLLGILTIGITWLLDIKTMDRFDDPKGKTITINATD